MPTDLDEPRTEHSDHFEHGTPDSAPSEHEHDLEGGPVKSFLEHLEDLRWVLIKSVTAIGLGMLICLIAGRVVMDILLVPLHKTKINYPGTNHIVSVSAGTNKFGRFLLNDEQQRRYSFGEARFIDLTVDLVPTGTNFSVVLVPTPTKDIDAAQRMNIEIINLSPIGGFMVAIQLALYGGLVLSAPFVFYFVAGFIFPALRLHEKHYVYRGLGFGFTLFAAGVSFCYYILMPLALKASAAYSNWLGLGATQWRAEDYISFVCKFMLGMGIGFQMPVVLLTLVKIGVLNYTILSKMRRYMIVINLILGAVLTTPEVLTQVLMAIPLQILYEVSVWIAWYWEKRDGKRKQTESAAH